MYQNIRFGQLGKIKKLRHTLIEKVHELTTPQLH